MSGLTKAELLKQNTAMKELLQRALDNEELITTRTCSEGQDWYNDVKDVLGDELKKNYDWISLEVVISNVELPYSKDICEHQFTAKVFDEDGNELNVDDVTFTDYHEEELT